MGRWIATLGLILLAAGLLIMAAEKLPFFRFGRLPGDIVYRQKNFVFYFPLATSLLLSLVLTLLLWALRRK